MKFVTLAAIVFSSVPTGLVAIAQVPAVTDNSDSTQVHKFPLLQFHIAEDEAAEGLVKAIITGTDQEVYLHRTAIVTEHHVSFARVVVDLNADPAIDIEFTQVGAERIKEATSAHKGKRLAVLFDGKVIFAPKIIDSISKAAVIAGVSSREEAHRIVHAIFHQPFSAYLLLVKPDWSQVANAAEIENQLREILADVTVPQEQLDKLPSSATDILFAPEIACLYTPDHFQQLLSWLTANDLLEKRIPFSVPEQHRARSITQDNRTVFGGTSSLVNPYEFLDLPTPQESEEHTFVSRTPEFLWHIQLDPQPDHFYVHVTRSLEVMEKSRGQQVGISRGELDKSRWYVSVPQGFVVVSNAFPVQTEGQLREGARRKGFDALLVLTLEHGGALDEDAVAPRLRLPDRVDVLNGKHAPRYSFPTSNDLPAENNSGRRTSRRHSPSVPADSGLAGLGLGGDNDPVQRSASAASVFTVKIFRVRSGAAESSAAMLQQLLARDDATIVAQSQANSVIVRATPLVMAEVEQVMEALAGDQNSGAVVTFSAFDKITVPRKTPDIPQLRQEYETQEQLGRAIAAQLRTQLAQVPPTTDAELSSDLRDMVEKSFVLRRALHVAELADLERKVHQAHQAIQLRDRIKSQIVDRRVEDLLNPENRWESQRERVQADVASSADPTATNPSP